MLVVYKALAEMAGTFSFILVGACSILLTEKYPQIFPSFGVAVTFGSMICLMILVFGNLSGAHFNPAVTLAFAVAKRMPSSEILIYWASQFVGGLAAVGLLIFLKKM